MDKAKSSPANGRKSPQRHRRFGCADRGRVSARNSHSSFGSAGIWKVDLRISVSLRWYLEARRDWAIRLFARGETVFLLQLFAGGIQAGRAGQDRTLHLRQSSRDEGRVHTRRLKTSGRGDIEPQGYS